MKIVEMRVTPVAIADPPLRSAYGRHAPYALRTIVELVSEDGITGAGETHGGEAILADFARVREAVIGRDVYDLGRLRQAICGVWAEEHAPGNAMLVADVALRAPLRVFGALEIAALDLIGKSTGRPVCELLGGRVRDAVPFSAYLFYKHAGGGGEGDDARPDRWGEAMTPEGVVAQARQFISEYGFGSIKLKAGVLPAEQEIATIIALREAIGPDVPLRIDPNGAWSVPTSLEVGRRLDGLLEYLEDPAPGMDGMAAVRQGLLAEGIETPLATNVVVLDFSTIAGAVRTDAVQVILGDHHYWGGARAIVELGRVCETFDLGLSMHSNSHLGLSLLAMTHAAAATLRLTYACDTHYPWQDPADEILVGGKVPFVDGAVRVPDRPGLGGEIDRDALARGHERYQRCGYRTRDDAAEMRRFVDPAWECRFPAW